MAIVYLIPAPLDEESLQSIPAYVLDAVKQCTVTDKSNALRWGKFM